VLRVMNGFSEIGVDVVDESGGRYHVSGHANRPDIEALHDLVRPGLVIPMHGEHRHLREHVRIARARGHAAELVTNGMVVDLAGDRPEVVEFIETGRLYLDGTALVGAIDGVVRDRIRMAQNGHVTVTVVLDEGDEPLGDPWADLMGLPPASRAGREIARLIEAELSEFLARAGRKVLCDDARLDEGIRRVVRQVTMEEIGKKPEVTVVVSRLSEG
jgi:ribonuclease J